MYDLDSKLRKIIFDNDYDFCCDLVLYFFLPPFWDMETRCQASFGGMFDFDSHATKIASSLFFEQKKLLNYTIS